ncbi:hypothetical protein C365_02925 [Cryptococcus neoformans Bt85]|nr:hypothetical protein C365_02925 [Cryptococcus neoformans var. grubii Bt85]OXM79245.1 hypothetical protein C364_02738 [Cryptococcus neoformans var. grubii Bt63]
MPRSSNVRTSSSLGNPYRRTNDVIEVASIGPEETLPQIAVVRCRCALCPRGGRTMQYRTWLNHRINLEFSEADNQPLSSSSGADDVAAPTLPSVPLSDDSVPGDISIPRLSPPAGQSTSFSDDAISTGQEAAQGGLEREPMDIDDGQGYNGFPAIMVDEPLLETGFEGDGDADVIHDRFGHQLSKWPTKVPESLTLFTRAGNPALIKMKPSSAPNQLQGVCLYLPPSLPSSQSSSPLCRAAPAIRRHGEGCHTGHP